MEGGITIQNSTELGQTILDVCKLMISCVTRRLPRAMQLLISNYLLGMELSLDYLISKRFIIASPPLLNVSIVPSITGLKFDETSCDN
jgi:hypothetical protein